VDDVNTKKLRYIISCVCTTEQDYITRPLIRTDYIYILEQPDHL